MDKKLKKLKALFCKKSKEGNVGLEISDAEKDEDFWNAAWDAHKDLIADQFVQSMVQGSEEVVIPVPYLTDANHYELSASATQSVYTEILPSGKSVQNYIVQPSVFALADGEYVNEAAPQFKLKSQFLRSPQKVIAARYGDYKQDLYEVLFSFFNPRIYSMTTELTGLKLHINPSDFEDKTQIYVIDKVWVCDRVVGSLKVKLPSHGKKELEYLAEISQENIPCYGVPVCFSLSKYPLDEQTVIQSAAEFNINDIRTNPWEKKSPRTQPPLKPTEESGSGATNGESSSSQTQENVE